MEKMTVKWLRDVICNTLEKTEKNGLSIIRRNLAWEKWFQCNLFAEMALKGMNVWCEVCMDEIVHSPGKRVDFVFINADNSVTLMELKCRSLYQNARETVGGFFDDIDKLSNLNAGESYRRCCVLLFEAGSVEDYAEMKTRINNPEKNFSNWKLLLEQVNGVSNMHIAIAYYNMPEEIISLD